MIFVCRGQPPFRVLLACGRSCCYGLSHFLQLTFPCWHSRVCFSFHKFHFMLHTAIASPTQELSFIHSLRSIPLISLSGYMFFPTHKSMWLQPCSVSLHTASPPHTYTLIVHSLQYTPFVHYFQPLPFQRNVRAKNAPNQLPAAPVHRAPRFLCPGHSLHSQRLAHNAQAEYFVPFLFTRISALLSTLAQGCFSCVEFFRCAFHQIIM